MRETTQQRCRRCSFLFDVDGSGAETNKGLDRSDSQFDPWICGLCEARMSEHQESSTASS